MTTIIRTPQGTYQIDGPHGPKTLGVGPDSELWDLVSQFAAEHPELVEDMPMPEAPPVIEPTLDEVKAHTCSTIEAMLHERLEVGIEIQFASGPHRIQARKDDQAAMGSYFTLLTIAGVSEGLVWCDRANIDFVMTLDEFRAMMIQVGVFVEAKYQLVRDAKRMARAAESADGVAQVLQVFEAALAG